MAKSGKPKAKSKPAAKSAKSAKGGGKPVKTVSKDAKSSAKVPQKSAAKPPVKTAGAAGGGAPAKGAPSGSPLVAGGGSQGKTPPKGITIVSNKPIRKPKPKKLEMPVSEPLLKAGARWKPLIQSGPKAPPSSGIPGLLTPTEFKADPKARLPKKELDRYREILIRKRNELIGDVAHMEDEALRQNSGSLSNLPQHMAEQGSDTCDQSLSLDLAQVDRNLIKEIDEALKRIDDGSYGICLRTGKRISPERLAEVPWAKYTIEAAREMERQPFTITARSVSSGRSSGGDED
jgi:RNA polymerase-binding transcription factor DksA